MFNGEVALVTGSGSGIGLEAARLFAEAGCRVAAGVHRAEDLDRLADQPGEIFSFILDVTDRAQWENATQRVIERFGGIDILFNNAGSTIRGDIVETDRELWDKTININLNSVYLGCRAVIPHMLERGSGVIVNNASINGIRGNWKLIAYSAAKGGVVAMTRSLALDCAQRGIRVNCICPATVGDTRMTQDAIGAAEDPEAMKQAFASLHPIGRMATAREVAAVAVFLASSDASFLTGAVIPVDGGRASR